MHPSQTNRNSKSKEIFSSVYLFLQLRNSNFYNAVDLIICGKNILSNTFLFLLTRFIALPSFEPLFELRYAWFRRLISATKRKKEKGLN